MWFGLTLKTIRSLVGSLFTITICITFLQLGAGNSCSLLPVPVRFKRNFLSFPGGHSPRMKREFYRSAFHFYHSTTHWQVLSSKSVIITSFENRTRRKRSEVHSSQRQGLKMYVNSFDVSQLSQVLRNFSGFGRVDEVKPVFIHLRFDICPSCLKCMMVFYTHFPYFNEVLGNLSMSPGFLCIEFRLWRPVFMEEKTEVFYW